MENDRNQAEDVSGFSVREKLEIWVSNSHCQTMPTLERREWDKLLK